MADPINDGGPAFPHMMVTGHRDYAGGMSQRDWFATHYPTTELSESWAAVVMGEAPPKWETGNEMNCMRWWLEADARVRFMHADAMLKAREARP